MDKQHQKSLKRGFKWQIRRGFNDSRITFSGIFSGFDLLLLISYNICNIYTYNFYKKYLSIYFKKNHKRQIANAESGYCLYIANKNDRRNQVLQKPEAAVQRCSYEKMFRKYAAKLQDNTHAEVRFQ